MLRFPNLPLVALLCALPPFLSGCGGNAPVGAPTGVAPQQPTTTAAHAATPSGVSTAPAPTAGAGANYAQYAGIARQATQHVGKMAQTYEALLQSRDTSNVGGKLNTAARALDGQWQQLRRLPTPTAQEAVQLKREVIGPLKDALQRAYRADRKVEREFFVFGRGMGSALYPAEEIVRQLQQALPDSERDPVGPPPNPGAPPSANRSFGQFVDLGPDAVRPPQRGQGDAASVPWRVKVDPPEHAPHPGDKVVLDIAVPGFPQRFSQSDKFWEGRHVRILYPGRPGNVVAVGLNADSKDVREVWTMFPRKRLGTIRGPHLGSSRLMAISPDGKYFAAHPLGGDIIGLWDVDKARPAGTVALPEKTFPTIVDFANQNRLVYVHGKTLVVRSVPDGKLEHELTMAGECRDSPFHSGTPWALSPGGRYLAAPHQDAFRSNIYLYDLVSGQTAGALEVAEHSWFTACRFSDDGARLAVLIVGRDETIIQLWDVPDGTLAEQWQIGGDVPKALETNREYQGPAVEWFPDGKTLLIYGRGLFDLEQGDLKKNLPDNPPYRILPIDSTRIAVIQNKKLVPYDLTKVEEGVAAAGGGGFGASVRTGNSLPGTTRSQGGFGASRVAGGKGRGSGGARPTGAENAAAFAAAFASTTPVPEPIRAVRTGVEVKTLTPPPGWKANPAVAAPPEIGAAPVEVPGGEVFHVTLTGGAQPRAVVMYSSERLQFWNGACRNTDSAKTWIEQFNLSGGPAGPKLEFPLPAGLLCTAPSGGRIVTRGLAQFDRLDAWDLAGGTHVVGFRPYPQGSYRGGQPVIWGAMLTDELLLTADAGRLSLWKLPECKALYEVLAPSEVTPSISLARDRVAVVNEERTGLMLLDARTGEPLGGVRLSGAVGKISATAFDSTGALLAVATEHPSGGEVAILDLPSGKPVTMFPVPAVPNVVQWCGSDHLLLDGAYLVHAGTGLLAWVYDLKSGGLHVLDSPTAATGSSPRTPKRRAGLCSPRPRSPILPSRRRSARQRPPRSCCTPAARWPSTCSFPTPPAAAVSRRKSARPSPASMPPATSRSPTRLPCASRSAASRARRARNSPTTSSASAAARSADSALTSRSSASPGRSS